MKDHDAERVKAKRRVRELNKHLRDLTDTVAAYLKAHDAEMATPSTKERGIRLASLANKLQLQNDIARRFGLGKR